MTVSRPRFDAALTIRNGLNRATSHPVELGTDATFDGDDVVTVVQATQRPATGSLPGNRWLFTSDVTLLTYGPDVDAALTAGREVADAMLDLIAVEGVRLSSTTCTGEPVSQGRQSPTGAATVISTYVTYLRSEV